MGPLICHNCASPVSDEQKADYETKRLSFNQVRSSCGSDECGGTFTSHPKNEKQLQNAKKKKGALKRGVPSWDRKGSQAKKPKVDL